MLTQTELTDTFGGEANYSWVRRCEFTVPEGASRQTIMRRGKRALGLTGTPCVVEDWGYYFSLRPQSSSTIAFLTIKD
jgi:hypothetical protein